MAEKPVAQFQVQRMAEGQDQVVGIAWRQADQIVVTSRFRFTRDEALETTLSGR